jgi:hypothetical protein
MLCDSTVPSCSALSFSILSVVLLKGCFKRFIETKRVNVVIYRGVCINVPLSIILTCSVYEVTIREMVGVLTVSVPFRSRVPYVVAGPSDFSTRVPLLIFTAVYLLCR